jgi:AraC-like DNA-binding protein
MIYREFQPNILLSPYIETYWATVGFEGEERYYKVLPDGCVDIIFSFELSKQFGMESFSQNIIGTMTTYIEDSYSDKVDLLGIRFRPAGFTAFTRTPVYEFTDRRISLSLVETLFDETFYAELPSKKTAEERVQYIEAYFIQNLKNIFEPESQIVYAVNLIRQTKGQLPLAEVASKSCLSLRHFERKFKSIIGISPKTFSKITKFRNTISYLENNPHASLFFTAIDCGYYDQAHLIKDFKSLSGDSPSCFKL